MLRRSLTLRVRGPVDPAVAWERYARPALWASWAPQISKVQCSTERLMPAATGRVFGPLGVHLDFVVDAVDEATREWMWTVRRGPLRLVLTHGVIARGRGCETWLRVDGPLPVVAAYAPLARLALARLVRSTA